MNLQSVNIRKVIQPGSSLMGEYLGCTPVGLRFLGKNIMLFKYSTLLKAEMYITAGLVPALHLSQKYLWWSWKFLLYPRVAVVAGHIGLIL